jgi:enoyl-CoA hydratase/carnithine racemase
MKHWQLTTDEQRIAWLTFDQADSAVNTLGAETLDELESALGTCEATAPAGLVVRSGKDAGFCAGADLRAFAGLTDQAAAAALIRRAQGLLTRLEGLACPSLALIQGHCLGGGLELALACTYRVAADDPRTQLGFPEVRVGIFPGFGGTVRAPRVLGHLKALELMLGGRNLSGRAAKAIGLVDVCVPPRLLREAAVGLLAQAPTRRRPALVQRAAAWPGVRALVARRLRRQVSAEADSAHYPAPRALIDHWGCHAGDPAALYAGEAQTVPRLLAGETAQNLVRLFLLRERLRSAAPGQIAAPQRPHVVGAGVMGGDIAAWAALRGFEVSLTGPPPRGPDPRPATRRGPVPGQAQGVGGGARRSRPADPRRSRRRRGQGYYRWEAGRALRGKDAAPFAKEQQDRLMLRLLNESVACLREGVVADADALDAGLVFGAGFAPFRGGPLHDLRRSGAGESLARLQGLHQRLGERFRPDPGWASLTGGSPC